MVLWQKPGGLIGSRAVGSRAKAISPHVRVHDRDPHAGGLTSPPATCAEMYA